MKRLLIRGTVSLMVLAALWLAAGCPPQVQETGPTAGFTATPVSGLAPLTVLFTDTSINGDRVIKHRTWNFGDELLSTEKNPVHEYTEPGVYTVALTVATATRTDVEQKVEYITVLSAEGEGQTEGASEGESEGPAEGVLEGEPEEQVEGAPEGELEGQFEGEATL